MNKFIFSITLLVVCINLYKSQITYVKYDAIGLNNGSSWQNAYTDLSLAINSTNVGQIWVSQGTYLPSTDVNGQIPIDPRLKTFKLKPSVEIYGGFNGLENNLNQRNWALNKTILSGDIGIIGEWSDNVVNVVSNSEWTSLNSNTIIDGLTIKNGYASNGGGGVHVNYANGSTFKIRNCIIEDNYSTGRGGGLFIAFCSPLIENCVIRNNAAYSAGGIYLFKSNAIITNNQIQNNYATGHSLHWGEGGGIYTANYSNPKIISNSISGNVAVYKGGAVYHDAVYELVFVNNIVSGNQSRDGGGLFLRTLTYCFNNLFFDNAATWNGGAIFMDYDANKSQLINNTIVQNSAGTSGGGLYIYQANPDVTNSIIYENSSPLGPQIRAYNNAGDWAPDFRFCNIQGGLSNIVTSGNAILYQNNIDLNPLFVDATTNNFRLQSLSSLINAGTINSTIVPSSWTGINGQIIDFPTLDLDENTRINGEIDMGAYEFGSSLGTHEVDNVDLKIYPNPSKGIYKIDSNKNIETLVVYDMIGRKLIYKTENIGNVIDITNYPNGVYFVTIFISGKKITQKLIKK